MSADTGLNVQPHRDEQGQISAELLAANSRLLALRAQKNVTRETLPSGWLSKLASRVHESPSLVKEQKADRKSAVNRPITILADLLLASLKQNLAAEMRIWLLARQLDVKGQGSISVEDLKQSLTRKASKLKVCGWRRLRQLLQKGNGLFWQRDDHGRLWLSGAAKLAASLDIISIKRHAIELPISSLVASMSKVKAHFYTAFHSVRSDNDSFANPISRDRLQQITGVSKRTQARYDRTSAIEKRQCLAVGETYSAENKQKRLWQGKSAFKFIDKRGEIGRKGANYVAWNLPNQYGGVHKTASKRQIAKKINQQLARFRHKAQESEEKAQLPSSRLSKSDKTTSDLVNNRERGNDCGKDQKTLFFNDGKSFAKKTYERYWSQPSARIWFSYEN